MSKSKVYPTFISPKNNNYVNYSNIVNQSSFLILVETILGINRMYLLQYNKYVIAFSKIYSVLICVAIICYDIRIFIILTSTTRLSTLIITVVEYALFIITVMTSGKDQFKMLFKNLSTFDETLNIQNDLTITSSKARVIAYTLTVILLNVLEAILLTRVSGMNILFTVSVLVKTSSHDLEQLVFFSHLRDIYMRILIVKAHAAKMFDVNYNKDKLSIVERLCEKKKFDVSDLHRVYELLHKCSEQLCSAMNFSMLLVFIVSALSTILILKYLISVAQMDVPNTNLNLLILYVVFRCLKYTTLVIIPCYYASVTAAQTMNLRTILHDAVNTLPICKTERRKVKTFFHLTRESDFSYAICGIIELDMTLPLNYMSLCTTYLIIIIQFSKFID